MTLVSLAAPITLATIISVFIFAGLWRAGQIEKLTGGSPWWVAAASAVIGLPRVVFLYYARARTLSSGFDVFCVAIASQVIGAAAVYFIMQAFANKLDETWSERAPSLLGGAFILFVVALLAFRG